MKTSTGTTMPLKYNGNLFIYLFSKRGRWRRGQTPPTITVSTIDYTSPEKTDIIHVSFMQITRKQQHPDKHHLIGKFAFTAACRQSTYIYQT